MTPMTPQGSGWKSEIHWISSVGIQSDAQWYSFASGCSFSSIHIHTKAKNGQKSHFSVQFGAKMAPMSHRWGISKFKNCSRRSGGLYSNPQSWLIVLKRWFRSITWHFLAKNSILGHFQYIFYTLQGKIKQVVCKTPPTPQRRLIFCFQHPIGILDLGLISVGG